MIFIGLDDTDTLESRGTGHLARQIAAALAADYAIWRGSPPTAADRVPCQEQQQRGYPARRRPRDEFRRPDQRLRR